MPTSCTLSPLGMIPNTFEPLSPPPTTTAPPGSWTKVWQSCVMFEPETFVVTHVLVTLPWVQPVVRPTLLTVFPMAKLDVVLSCDVTVNSPVTSRLPLFGPEVFEITPRNEPTLEL